MIYLLAKTKKHLTLLQRSLIVTIIVCLTSCAELQQVVDNLPENAPQLSNADIAMGLRQALNQGIDQQVSSLMQEDGFYKNDLVKILLPEELQKVDKALRNVGLSNLADEGLKLLNRAAEDAVKTATPIFIEAVKEITFADAKAILLGNNDAATQYLAQKTKAPLYQQFHPVINNSFNNVGANTIWTSIIETYNDLPFTSDVNPNLTDYVTEEALKGVYKMIAIEENAIRTSYKSRTTTILKQVFALQD
ncbi:DUF4197 domain-containing protein [Bizionia sediminis]|uniref:DUF4197 domain-containing protein n=1 Tax=Bizionia sediminis TaxID=1737064 RepID=A0ABW5KRA2_9FLAO